MPNQSAAMILPIQPVPHEVLQFSDALTLILPLADWNPGPSTDADDTQTPCLGYCLVDGAWLEGRDLDPRLNTFLGGFLNMLTTVAIGLPGSVPDRGEVFTYLKSGESLLDVTLAPRGDVAERIADWFARAASRGDADDAGPRLVARCQLERLETDGPGASRLFHALDTQPPRPLLGWEVVELEGRDLDEQRRRATST